LPFVASCVPPPLRPINTRRAVGIVAAGAREQNHCCADDKDTNHISLIDRYSTTFVSLIVAFRMAIAQIRTELIATRMAPVAMDVPLAIVH